MEWSADKITYIRTVQIYLATKLFSYIFVKIFYIFQDKNLIKERKILYEKNDFAEGSKILLDTDLKIILLEL